VAIYRRVVVGGVIVVELGGTTTGESGVEGVTELGGT